MKKTLNNIDIIFVKSIKSTFVEYRMTVALQNNHNSSQISLTLYDKPNFKIVLRRKLYSNQTKFSN